VLYYSYSGRYFKYYRLVALSEVVKRLENDDINTRLRNEYLSMGAIITYQFNAIIYRPAEGRAEKILLEAACQHTMDENGLLRPSLYNRGCYFLSDVVESNASYHLPMVRPIDFEVLLSLYRRDSIEDVEAEFHVPRKRKGTHLSNSRPSKRRKRIIGNPGDSQWSGNGPDMGTNEGGTEKIDTRDKETKDRSRQPGDFNLHYDAHCQRSETC